MIIGIKIARDFRAKYPYSIEIYESSYKTVQCMYSSNMNKEDLLKVADQLQQCAADIREYLSRESHD